jgi:hypothetical protein
MPERSIGQLVRHANCWAAYRDWVTTSPPQTGSAVAFIQYPAIAPVPGPVKGVPVVALRICHPGSEEDAKRAILPFHTIAGSILDTTRVMPYREIGSVTMDRHCIFLA